MPAVGLLSFLVLSFVVSLKVERRIVAHYLPAVPGASVAKFALVAHCCSYGFLLAVMLLPVFFLLSR
jgi:hypothetical protein